MTEVEQIISEHHILDEGVDCTGTKYRRRKILGNNTIDITGKHINKLIVLFPVTRIEKQDYKLLYWLCLCECNNLKIILSSNLRHRLTKSCGCLRTNTTRQHITKINHKRKLDLRNQIFW